MNRGADNALIRVREAMCRIGRHGTLRIDDFAIGRAEKWCLFGPNGAGKSLLADLIRGKRMESGHYVSYGAGFDPARDIHLVSFEEQQRLWERDNRLDISEYQATAQDAGTLVRDLVRGARVDADHDEALYASLVDELALESFSQQGIRFLSSGQIRRVLIARALYAWREDSTPLLIMDDPLESIDRESRQRIVDCIDRHLQAGASCLQLCRREGDILPEIDHLALMDGLRIIEQGPRTTVEQGAGFLALSGRRARLPTALPEPAQAREALDLAAPLIELRDVDAAYGDNKVLANINWTMESDHHVLVEGPNGCGKSTLLSLIDGENHKAYGQQVSLFGRRRGSGETVWDIKARFGLVSNELHNKYVKGWRVIDVVVSGFYDSVGLYDDSGSKEVEVARQWLEALGIEALSQHYYHEISFGQQRLVLLARAMVKQPAILVLDEPCVGLDDYHRDFILRMLDLIAAQTATRIVYVSHVQGEQPHCINQRLRFTPAETGAFTLKQSPL